MTAVAEMGDKSQLVALAFATRFRPAIVLAGVSAATFLVHLGPVVQGRFLVTLLPGQWITLAAGLAFIGFGIWTLHGDKLADDPADFQSQYRATLAAAAATVADAAIRGELQGIIEQVAEEHGVGR